MNKKRNSKVQENKSESYSLVEVFESIINRFEKRMKNVFENADKFVSKAHDHSLTIPQLKLLKRQLEQLISIYSMVDWRDQEEFNSREEKEEFHKNVKLAITNFEKALVVVSSKINDRELLPPPPAPNLTHSIIEILPESITEDVFKKILFDLGVMVDGRDAGKSNDFISGVVSALIAEKLKKTKTGDLQPHYPTVKLLNSYIGRKTTAKPRRLGPGFKDGETNTTNYFIKLR